MLRTKKWCPNSHTSFLRDGQSSLQLCSSGNSISAAPTPIWRILCGVLCTWRFPPGRIRKFKIPLGCLFSLRLAHVENKSSGSIMCLENKSTSIQRVSYKKLLLPFGVQNADVVIIELHSKSHQNSLLCAIIITKVQQFLLFLVWCKIVCVVMNRVHD